MNYYVSAAQSGPGDGSPDRPFSTISQAAALALPGDQVLVLPGVYREWVSPAQPRVSYRSTEPGKAVITGAEPVTDWTPLAGGLWETVVPDALFGDFRPFETELSGDWYMSPEKHFHLGEVYLNGLPIGEAPADDRNAPGWRCEKVPGGLRLTVPFGGADPRQALVEINVRPHCFWPRQTGVDGIRVSGFTMNKAATQWAPPTALQQGLIGPHWSRGWIIEDNVISDSRCCGVSLGKPQEPQDNAWSRLGRKHGTQQERDAVLRAVHSGWSRQTVGSHTVRRNRIFRCGQAGIVGHLGGAFSLIEDNEIRDIRPPFDGAEIGGIKLHAAIDTVLRRNVIHHCHRGLWLDWQAQGTRVSGNLFYENQGAEDLFIEVSHGPTLVDNNIFLSDTAFRCISQGVAFVHNLCLGKLLAFRVEDRFTPYHFPHETAVAGFMTILGGDLQIYNNLFSGPAAGLSAFDSYPTPAEFEAAVKQARSPGDHSHLMLPVRAAGNGYLQGAAPWKKETAPALLTGEVTAGKTLTVPAEVLAQAKRLSCRPVCTELLEPAFQPEQAFEAPDGSPLSVDRDFAGRIRSALSPAAGPFETEETVALPL